MSETPTDKMEETSSETFIGRVYRISSPDTDQIYVGSTCKELKRRLLRHKLDMRRWQRGTHHYVSSYEILKYDNAEIDIVEEDEFLDKHHMLEREKYWIQKLNCVNKLIPCKTIEDCTSKQKHYYNNIEKYRVRDANRVKKPCLYCNKIMRTDYISKHIKAKHEVR